MYNIDWTRKAYKQLQKIRDKKERISIYDAGETLRKWPDCPNIKALTDHEYGYRLRVGGWRIFFDVQKTVRIIKIQEVKKRNENTY